MLRGGGDDRRGEALTGDRDMTGGGFERVDPCGEAQRRAVFGEPNAGRLGQQAAKIDARQQQVGVFPARAAQAVAQDVGENLGGGALGAEC